MFASRIFLAAGILLLSGMNAWSQAVPTPHLVTEAINESQVIRPQGNTHILARAQNDGGAAPDDLPMNRMQLVLKRSALQEQALQKLLVDLQDPSSPSFHQWLTPEQFGAQFGPSDADVQAVVSWLKDKGFQVAGVSKGRLSIEFSGSAGQVRQAFNTEIHKYNANGETHWANNADPALPAALGPVVEGIASLHNFVAAPQVKVSDERFAMNKATGKISPLFTSTSGSHAMGPADFATIYNSLIYGAAGTAIAIVGRSNINVQDVIDFRSYFGLSANPPQIIINGPDPGDLGGNEEVEAVLDTTWAGAVATDATVKLVVSASTNTTDGVALSELYIIDNNLAPIMSESFGSCEAAYTKSEAAYVSLLAEQAAAQGITYVVSSGDSGAAGCDSPSSTTATGPLSVNILASSPYVVAVGGTQFNDTANSTVWWSSTTQSSNKLSARGYIPENVWNEGVTNNNLYASGGGASIYFSKPTWQTGVTGIPNDGARDIPDISLAAAVHDPYLLCLRGSCSGTSVGLYGVGGTSASSPAFAAAMAFVVGQYSRQGQANKILYLMAANINYNSCNGSNVTSPNTFPGCALTDITVGSNAVRGENGYGQTNAPYQAAVGYDLATGLGSIQIRGMSAQWISYQHIVDQFPILYNFGQGQINGPPSQIYPFLDTTGKSGLKFGVDFIYTYSQGQYGFIFTPKYPGFRTDAVIFSNGNPPGLFTGVGVGPQAVVSPGTISTFVGNNSSSNPVALSSPKGLAADPAGNVYVADSLNHIIRQINAQTGVATIVAGTGSAGFSGDGGLATAAQLNQPSSVTLDRLANIYIADAGNALIRKVDTTTGVISTIAGTGSTGFSIGGGIASNATLGNPSGLATDPSGNLFIADDLNGVVWKIPTGTNTISVFAGTGTRGYTGDGGAASSAQLNSPEGLATDIAGNLYIADASSNVIRKVSAANQIITTIAGNGTSGFSGDGGLARGAQLSSPFGVALNAAGDLFIAETGNSNIRRVSVLNNIITTVSGNQTAAYTGDGGPANTAGLNRPNSVVLDGPGNIYIATASNVIRKINSTSSVLNFTSSNSTQTALVSNFGNSTLTLSGIALSTGFSQVSSGSSDCTATTALAPGGSCAVVVSRSPQAGTATGTLTVTDNSYNLTGSPQTASLTFSGGSPELSLSRTAIGFGVQAVGKPSSALPVTISNSGSASLSLTNISLSGTNAGDFTLNTACGTTLAVGASCTISVSFTPSATGSRNATITITANAANSPQTITLSGNSAVPKWMIDIELPSSSYSTFQGTANFSGWAFLNISPLSSITIAVDGVPVGSANYGIARPDVCAIYTTVPGCPNVGWGFTLDTTTIANGSHSLSVIATAANGQRSASSTQFTVANWTTGNPLKISIDAPSAGATYSGSVSFGGWALSDTATVSSVLMTVDGVPYANASYGGARNDVCTVYPGRPGCPNVGWNAALNTTLLPDGPHTLGVTATAGGQRSTVTKQFNISNAGSPIHVSIDSPNSQSPSFAGSVAIGGWAVADSSQVILINVRVDELLVGTAAYGGTRTDVCQVYTGRAGCPNVGWNYVLNSTTLTNGTHTLAVTAFTSSGAAATVSKPFTVDNSKISTGTRISIDSPGSNSGPLLGLANVYGWAINDNGAISSIQYTIDGVPYGYASYGGSRPDVCAVFPGRPGCPNVGWSFTLDTTQFASGQHTLGVIAMTGNQQFTASSTFTIANWVTSNPMLVSIDRPSAQSGPLSGSMGVGGWAINTMSAISSVAVSVDGVPLGNAVYGSSRSDVCAALPGAAGCPNVGWNFGLDTTQFPDGQHTFAVTVTAQSGQRYTATSPLTVANAAGNPIRISIDKPANYDALGGVTNVGGWATADNAAIVTIQVFIDGVFYGTAAYGGSRPDVCRVLPGRPGCPNVGWNATLDTTGLANGIHTIEATAISSTGAKATVGNSFTVQN